MFSQNDPRWKDIRLGTSDTTIGANGCLITCIGEIAGMTPPEVNQALLDVGGYANDNLVIWSKIKEATGVDYLKRGWTYDELIILEAIKQYGQCIVEVDGAPIGGRNHFVIYIEGQKLLDPWDGKEKSTGVYEPKGYAILDKREHTMKNGIDVSHHNGKAYEENAPIDMFITRSSYVGYGSLQFTVDGQFRNNATLYKDKLRGVFHYYSSERGWEYQAEAFIELVKDYDFDFFAPDMERYYNYPDREYAIGGANFIDKVQQDLGIPGIVYSAKYFYQDHLKPYTDRYDDIPLWIASYIWHGKSIEYIRNKIRNGEGKPSTPLSHPDWVIWQYTSDGEGPNYGYHGRMDLNLVKPDFYNSFFDNPGPEPDTEWNNALDAGIKALENLKR